MVAVATLCRYPRETPRRKHCQWSAGLGHMSCDCIARHASEGAGSSGGTRAFTRCSICVHVGR
eukprot:383238-Pyramimonas_sp.AAC.1